MNKIIIVVMLLTLSRAAIADEYDLFVANSDTTWGAEMDSLYYEHFGSSLSFDLGDSLIYASEASAFIGFDTNLPAKGQVAYGSASGSLTDTTTIDDRFYFIHNAYIDGLDANTQYYYRLIARDERNNTISSDEGTFATQATGRSGVRYIDGTGSFPQTLNTDSTYVLTDDITCDTRGFTLAGTDVTLDLNGFTLTYDNGTPVVSAGLTWDNYVYSTTSTFGISGNGTFSGTIINGKIVQGSNLGDGDIGFGFNPIYLRTPSNRIVDVIGIDATWGSDDTHGIVQHIEGGTMNVKRSTLKDLGTVITNRNQGGIAIACRNGQGKFSNNLVKRTRHQGVYNAGLNSLNNEIYIDSWATNSYGILPAVGDTIAYNKVFGTGYHNVAIGSEDYSVVHDNFVFVMAGAPSDRDDEYGDHSSAIGIRLTQYANVGDQKDYHSPHYYNNTVITKARNGGGNGQARGVQLCTHARIWDARFYDNTVKVEVLTSDVPVTIGAAVCNGVESEWEDAVDPTIWSTNTFISNSVFIKFGDAYAVGSHHHFRNNTFVSFAAPSGYTATDLTVGGWGPQNTTGNRIIDYDALGLADGGFVDDDCTFTNSTGYTADYAVGHSLWIKATSDGTTPIASTSIRADDHDGWKMSETSNTEGVVRLELIEFDYTATNGSASATKTTRSPTDWWIVAGSDSVQVDSTIWSYDNNEASPLTINFATGAAGTAITAPTNLKADTGHQGQ